MELNPCSVYFFNILYNISHLNNISDLDIAHIYISHPVEAEILFSEFRAICMSQSFSNLSFVHFLWQEYPQYMYPNKLLRLYVPPFLLFLGTFGNIFSLLVLIKKRKSTYIYLAVLAIVDLFMLYIGLLRLWIAEFTVDLRDTADWLCKVVNYIGHGSSHASAWMIVAVTTERFIAVCHPMTVPRMCNIKHTKWIILVIISALFAINTPLLLTLDLKSTVYDGRHIYSCGASDRYKNIVKDIWPWIDAAIYSFVPCAIIISLNTLIIKETLAAAKRRVSLQEETLLRSRKASTSTTASQCSKTRGSVQSESLYQKSGSNRRASTNTNAYSYGRHGSLEETNFSQRFAYTRRASKITNAYMYCREECNLSKRFASIHSSSSNANINSSGRQHSLTESKLSQRFGPIRRASTSINVYSYAIPESNLSERFGSICSSITIKSDKRGSRSESRESGRLVLTLLMVSATFLITTLPMIIMQIAAAFSDFKQGEDPLDYALHIAKFTLARTVAELLMYVNHSINFFLYCASGSMFRRDIKIMLLSSPLVCLRQSLKRDKLLQSRTLETKL